MSMSRQDWDKNLKGFKSSTQRSKNLALICSVAALEHFAEHGDVVYLQEMHDAMPANYLRRAALLQWAKDHSPLTMGEDGKLAKDKSDKARPFDIAKAKEKAFWDYMPEREVVFFDESDIIVSLERAIKRFESKNMKPKSEAAKAELDKAKDAIKALKPVIADDESEDGAEDMADETTPADTDQPANQDAGDELEPRQAANG